MILWHMASPEVFDFCEIGNPNVDYYSGLVYRKLGIPRDLFTPIFAISRVAGWLAHWREQLGANRIFRPSQIYTGYSSRNWIPLDHR